MMRGHDLVNRTLLCDNCRMVGKTSKNQPQVEEPHDDQSCDENPDQEGNQDEEDELCGGEVGRAGREDCGTAGVHWS